MATLSKIYFHLFTIGSAGKIFTPVSLEGSEQRGPSNELSTTQIGIVTNMEGKTHLDVCFGFVEQTECRMPGTVWAQWDQNF